MFGSGIIEVVIGLVFVYFIMSLLCSVFTEWITRMMAMRASTLRDGIEKLLSDEEMTKNIFDHPLIQGLSPKPDNIANKIADLFIKLPVIRRFFSKSDQLGVKSHKNGKGPSNIPARDFALVLYDTIMRPNKDKPAYKSLKLAVSNIQNKNLKMTMELIHNSSRLKVEKIDDEINEFQVSLEKWFDGSMERVSGWYKRKSQLIILILAFLACLALNVDTFAITNSLFKDSTLRASIVAVAESRVQPSNTQDNAEEANIDEIMESLEILNLPIGWSEDFKTSFSAALPQKVPDDAGGWIIKLLGILFTALAVSLGSPFWFELLNKFVNLRAAGKKPENKAEAEVATISISPGG